MHRTPEGGEKVHEAVEEAHEAQEEHGLSPHANRLRIRAGMVLTILAVTLAVTALFVQRAIKAEITSRTDEAATRGSLETSQLLGADDLRSAQELTAIANLSGTQDTERATLMADAAADTTAAQDENSDTQTGTGTAQLSTRLAEEEQQSAANETRADRLEYGEVILEVALVLGSLSLLLLDARLLLAVVGASLIGVAVALTSLLS